MGARCCRLRDETGLAGRVLVGVVVWAFTAVIMLTTILATANQIDDRVAFIRGQVTPIDHDLDSVQLVETTNELASGIDAAAGPLSGQLDEVITRTESIIASAGSIDDTAGSINSTVRSIESTAREINGTVLAINGTAKAINGTVRSIDANASSINGSVHSINGNFKSVLDTARVIRGDHKASGIGGGLAGANRRIDTLLGLITAIKGDTGNILKLVGSIEASAKSINGKL